ncbi:MAG: trypsin-like peptidase domain-containing protein [Firmicutes bacterium]|nr:serine protease [Clostridiales bacterium]MBQ2846230.1 trypsin-like peptidase domain-containing protein [Bacillota bacterium]MBR6700997.1 trypsin-like peptidase domain-containing protein [Bacillota bacterium]
MFEDAIEKVSQYTRSVHSVLRAYGENKILTSTATLFFVNDEGYAITTRSFADLLIASGQMEKTFNEFKQEKAALPKDRKYENRLRELEAKYKYTEKSIVQARNMFIDCIDKMSGYTCHKHTQYDLAIIKFNDYSQLKYKNHAVFSKFPGSARQGKFLCRLGFPFPEFTNYRYNELQDTIEWTQEGKPGSPRFPLEGMLTRYLGDANGKFGIEMSTPGLRGMNGAPLFDEKGHVYGMQFGTRVMNHETEPEKLHLGLCISADIIKTFLNYHNVKYYEA